MPLCETIQAVVNYIHDADGNMTEYVDGNGSVCAHYEYDAFGNTVAQTGPLANGLKFRFSTKYRDAETGNIHFDKRPYRPPLGRFISQDPIGERGGLNLYGFCGNDPINKVDYLGLLITIQKNSIPKDVDEIAGGVRAQTAVDTSSVSISCTFVSSRSSCLKVDGKLKLEIRMLKSTSKRWDERYTRYDKTWGTPRLNLTEHSAALAHEQDHFQTMMAGFNVIMTLNKFDKNPCPGSAECEAKRQDLQQKYNQLRTEMSNHSLGFDTDERNMGNMYKTYPFSTTVQF